MDILVKVGYKQFIIKDASVPMVDKIITAIPVDSHYTNGSYQLFKTDDMIGIEVIDCDKYHPMTYVEWVASKTEIYNGNQDSVE